MITFVPSCFAQEAQEDLVLPNIFIWVVPDDVQEEAVPDEIMPERVNAGALKGYTEYKESAIYLEVKAPPKIDIKQPSLSEKIALKLHPKRVYTLEDSIVSSSGKFEQKTGNLSYGTTYSSAVRADTTQLERSTSLFTRYDFKKFALSSSFQKNLGTISGITYDEIYVVPEWKINSIFSLQNVLKADMTRDRRSNEVVLVVQPLKDRDRLNFEIGAGQTYYENSGLIRNKLRFSTKIKL